MIFKKKSLFFLIAGFLILAVISGLIFRFTLSSRLEETDLKSKITLFCKNSLDKAVKIENIYLDYKGNIVLNYFDLSISSDFNDNISLIKSSRLVLIPDIFKLTEGKLLIKKIKFENSSITIHKKFGKSYREMINTLLTFKTKSEEIEYIDINKLTIEFENSRLDYREVFRTKKLTISLKNLNAGIHFSGHRINYRVTGDIKPYKTASIKRGFINVEGELSRKTGISRNRIKIENFDLSYLNEFNKEYHIAGFSLNGGISFDFGLSFPGKNNFSSRGEVETNSLNIVSHLNPGHNILTNKNFNLTFDIDYSDEKSKFSINELRIFDDHINIPVNGYYLVNRKEKVLNLRVKPVKVDLTNISSYFSPVENVSYNGSLDFALEMNYDFKIDKNTRLSLKSELKDFNAEWLSNGKTEQVINNCNLTLLSETNRINLSFATGIFKSDFRFTGEMNIDSWHPFRSNSTISIKSNQVESDLLSAWLKEGINYLYGEAFRDSKRGFEMIYFLQTPEADTINNNNFSISYRSDNLIFGKKARLTGLSGELALNRGHIFLKDFTLGGYEGDYSLTFNGFFNRDYPYFEVKGHVKNLNMRDFTLDYGSPLRVTGRGSFICDYELNAFRIAHLMEQGRGTLTVSLSGGSLEKSKFLDRLTGFLAMNGYNNLLLNPLEVSNFNITLNQVGSYFFIRNFILNSDKARFTSFGTYNYQKGLQLNIFPVFSDTEKKTQTIPLRVRGPLLNPELQIIKNREIKSLSFFNVN